MVSGPLAMATSALNATSAPMVRWPPRTWRAPTHRKSAEVRKVTMVTAPSYVMIVKSARNWRRAMRWNWFSISSRNATSAPMALTVSMPLMASIWWEA